MTTLATSSNAKAVTRLDVCRRCTAPAHIHTQSTRMVNVHLTPHTHTTHTDLRRHCCGRVRVRVCVNVRDRGGRARRAHTGGRWRPCIHARVGAQQILAWVRSDREKRCKPAPSPTRSLLLYIYLDRRLPVTLFVYRLQELISALSLSLCVCVPRVPFTPSMHSTSRPVSVPRPRPTRVSGAGYRAITGGGSCCRNLSKSCSHICTIITRTSRVKPRRTHAPTETHTQTIYTHTRPK
jgi:hypothetical protein